MKLEDIFEMAAPLTPVEEFEDAFEAAHKESAMAAFSKVSFHEMSATELEISHIEVAKDKRGNGTGTKLMHFLIQLADHYDVTLYLSPATDADPEEGPDYERLREWYEGLGFERMSGRDLMKREPDESY
jgi:GNAT superfamily N-acetyltransferase